MTENDSNLGIRTGIDIGGTFTDLLVFDPVAGCFHFGKTLTTPSDPAGGARNGLEDLVRRGAVKADQIEMIVHGTTLVTNALIERKGARTALLTTAGFRDAIEIGREHRYDLYDLFIELPPPLVPRDLRLEVSERILADGSVLSALPEDEVTGHAAALAEMGIEAVAVCYLHSYQNADHERRTRQILEDLLPGVSISISADVVPEIREYERASTTVANVYVRPLVQRYLASLETSLAEMGFAGTLLVMLSSGGLCTVETAATHPIRLVESGPAAGALAAAQFGHLTGRPSLLSFDMGGTTAKCCLIDNFRPSLSADFEVSRVYRFKKGSGLPIKAPVIEMIEIGAGGGSIARVDQLGLLKVGPDSAGADPGPACYGRGGIQPTVTDADLLLGYLDPAYFLGGAMPLDVEAAKNAVASLARQLDMGLTETSWGIHQIVNEQMAGAARIHAIEQGKDPRQYPIFAFGGAGPAHAWHVAGILRSPEMIVPFGAGIASTIGFLVAPLAFDFVRSYVGEIDRLDWSQVNARLDEMSSEGTAMLAAAGVPEEMITLEPSAELRYTGQGHQILVPLPSRGLGQDYAPALAKAFELQYQRIYGRTAPGNTIEAINWRITASAPVPKLPLELLRSPGGGETQRIKGTRRIYLPELGDFFDSPVYDRYALLPGDTFAGPAVIEERESTIIVGSDGLIEVDDLLNVVVRRTRA